MAQRPNFREFSKPEFADLQIGELLANPDEIQRVEGYGDRRFYERVLSDDQCFSAFGQRRMAVTGAEVMVEPATSSAADKAAGDFVRELVQASEFDDHCDKMLYGLWYGHAVGECLWARDGRFVTLDRVKVRPSSRFHYAKQWNRNEGVGIFESTLNQPQGIERPPRKYWTFSAGAQHDENPYGTGLGHYCYWPVWFKRNDVKFWLIFLEKFGQPSVKLTAPQGWITDDKKREQLLALIDAIQTDSGVLIPEGVNAEILEAARSGSPDYESMRKAMDETIAKVILSQTLTLENSGGQYKATMQKGVRDEVIKGDADLLMGSFNRQVVRWLTEWNFPNANPPRVWRDTSEPEDLNSRAERDTKIYALGYEPNEDYITTTYGEGWQKKQAEPLPQIELPASDFMEALGVSVDKAVQRSDQEAIKEAARRLADQDAGAYSERIEAALAEFSETQDADRLHRFMLAMAASQHPESLRQTLERARFGSRLKGLSRFIKP